ncbi:2-dehydro-3-deoxygalactonokinase [Sodalis sp. dw_96]|uniref:2-dehydro-3-deoxygalactonokinase n=1 Tax=Sodalis sp. dw_96 TaxID=2719794 RepID=UPI001BD5D423|nr:2-dehydro-3-deoxygalactonokinase [Sodalis sp. dw_96]
MYVITIDTGTTNTRVCLWNASGCLAQASAPVGVRDTVLTGDNLALKAGISRLCDRVVDEGCLAPDEEPVVIAAGMITSALGLVELPHLTAPVGLGQLAQGMVNRRIDGFLNRPVWFIPGVKNAVPEVTLENIESMDMMRGEETETFGLLREGSTGASLVLLPGSHAKMVSISGEGLITGCITTLSGELLDVISKNTLIADALESGFCDDIDETMLLRGAAMSRRVGLSRVCFTIRIMDMFSDLSRNQRANILLGAVLDADVQAIKNSAALGMRGDTRIIIYGKAVLRRGLALLLRHDPYFTGELSTPESIPTSLSGLGALALARRRGIVPSTFYVNENPS